MAPDLDASTFQRKLETLAEVLAQKLRREAPKLLGATPGYVSVDLHVMLRQMIYTYNLFFFFYFYECVKKDSYYRKQYSMGLSSGLFKLLSNPWRVASAATPAVPPIACPRTLPSNSRASVGDVPIKASESASYPARQFPTVNFAEKFIPENSCCTSMPGSACPNGDCQNRDRFSATPSSSHVAHMPFPAT